MPQVGYDSYRPAVERSRTHKSRSDKEQKQSFWRKDRPRERELIWKTSPATETQMSGAERPRSADRSCDFDSSSKRARSYSMNARPSPASSVDFTPPDLFLRPKTPVGSRTSSIPHTTSTNPPVFASPNEEQPPQRASPASLADASMTAKIMDPRLRKPSHKADDVLASSTHSLHLADERHEDNQLGSLLRDLLNTVSEHHDAEREYHRQRGELEKSESELHKVTRMFPNPNNNAYIAQLRTEGKTSEVAMNTKKMHVDELSKRVDKCLRDFIARIATHKRFDMGIEGIRKDQMDESKRLDDLKDSNLTMQQDLDHMKALVTGLSGQVQEAIQKQEEEKTNFESQLNQIALESTVAKARHEQLEGGIASVKNDIMKTYSESLQEIEEQLKSQRTSLAGLSETFASQESLKAIERRVSEMLEKQEPLPRYSVHDFMTKAQLDGYVAVYNGFQSSVENRLRALEIQAAEQHPQPDHQTLLADLTKIVSLTVERNIRVTIDARLTQAETQLSILTAEVQDLSKRYGALGKRFDEHMENVKSLVQDVSELDNNQKALNSAVVAQTNDKKLQHDLTTVHGTLKILDQASKAHTHAIASLNQRYNNITTEPLVRQMVSIIEPMLVAIKPKLLDMHDQLEQVKLQQVSHSNNFKTIDARIGQISSIVPQVGELQTAQNEDATRRTAMSDDIRRIIESNTNLEGRIQSLQEETTAARTAVRITTEKAIKNVELDIISLCKANETKLKEDLSKTRQEFQGVLSEASEAVEQKVARLVEQKFAQLVEQVEEAREARDAINTRLTIIETMQLQKDGASIAEANHAGERKVISGEAEDSPKDDIAFSPTFERPKVESSAQIISQSKPDEGVQPHAKSSKPLSQRKRVAQSSSIAKHFQHDTNLGEASDTIDATPRPKHDRSKRKIYQDIIHISDSDQETAEDDDNDIGERYGNSRPLKTDYGKWIKKPDTHNSSQNSASPETGLPVNKSDGAKLKRKHESLSTTTKGHHKSNKSQRGSTPSSKQGGKRKRTL